MVLKVVEKSYKQNVPYYIGDNSSNFGWKKTNAEFLLIDVWESFDTKNDKNATWALCLHRSLPETFAHLLSYKPFPSKHININ